VSTGARASLPLVVVAAGAWLLVLWESAAMSAMGGGVLPTGVSMPPDLPAVPFMATWLTMMAAMMLPAIVPVVAAGRAAGILAVGAFAAGYLALWTAAGLVPLAVFAALRSMPQDELMGRGASLAAGVVLAGAGLYQFTPWKLACLRVCRSGPAVGLPAGLSYGLRCLGCCWALMAVLLVVGMMNLAWMVALAAVFVAERALGHEVVVARVVGVALVALGVLVAVLPIVA
jgi:predicted metal-binding membrane protein